MRVKPEGEPTPTLFPYCNPPRPFPPRQTHPSAHQKQGGGPGGREGGGGGGGEVLGVPPLPNPTRPNFAGAGPAPPRGGRQRKGPPPPARPIGQVNKKPRTPRGFFLRYHQDRALPRELIVTLAARHKLPAIYSSRFYVTSGGLVSYGADFVAASLEGRSRRAAFIVGRYILLGRAS